jgi:hypothetical protein
MVSYLNGAGKDGMAILKTRLGINGKQEKVGGDKT